MAAISLPRSRFHRAVAAASPLVVLLPFCRACSDARVLAGFAFFRLQTTAGGPGMAVTKFHALRPPSIGVRDYLERILKFASCSNQCFVLALVYIDRLIQRNNFVLSSLNVHRIIITSVMLAAKFFDDQYFNNAYYAKVGGVPTIELNALELEFLFSINFALHVPGDVYANYEAELQNHMISNVLCDCGECSPVPVAGEVTAHTGATCRTAPHPDVRVGFPPMATGVSGGAGGVHHVAGHASAAHSSTPPAGDPPASAAGDSGMGEAATAAASAVAGPHGSHSNPVGAISATVAPPAPAVGFPAGHVGYDAGM